jgi:copper homeostasis protein (lipoprotein)
VCTGGAQELGISELPATFAGTVPCADCPGIRYQLNLLPDRTFFSRMTYEERKTSLEDHGSWQLAEDGKRLLLRGEHNSNGQFAVRDVDTLRMLDGEGHEIESKLNYDLKRASTFEPIETEAHEVANVSLEDTDWKLTSVGDKPVSANTQQREAYLNLNSATRRVSGSGGCNQLVGGYELNGDHLKFSQMAGTRMACAEGMDTEGAFLQALGQVNAWKITGTLLELFDADGKLLARFESRAKK